MKMEIFKNLGSIIIVTIIVIYSTLTLAGDFEVLETNTDWQSEYFGELPFRSACLAFDLNNNLYANNLVADFFEDNYRIYSYSAPDYNFDVPPTLYATIEKIFEAISGLNFDEKGNLYVSEVITADNYIEYEYEDAGLIRKLSANTKHLSDPAIYLYFRPTGVAAIGSNIVYFSGRKWTDDDWGNIYKISNFNSPERRRDPIIELEDKVLTAIAVDRWGTIFVAPRFDDGWTVYGRNPYTGSPEWIATFNQLIEELTFDADGNLYAIEQVVSGEGKTEIIKLIPTNIVLNGCDTKIIDWTIDGETRIGDMLNECNEYTDHDEYVECVTEVTTQLMQEGYIRGEQLASIVTCAAQIDN